MVSWSEVFSKRFGRRIGLNGHLARFHKQIEQINGISPNIPGGEEEEKQFQYTTAAVGNGHGDVGDIPGGKANTAADVYARGDVGEGGDGAGYEPWRLWPEWMKPSKSEHRENMAKFLASLK